jgi:threonine/homoserine/homoserine lactone efflux protein
LPLGIAIIFGLVGMVVFVPPTLMALSVSDMTELTPAQYAIFKGCLAAVMVGSMIRLALSRR